MIRTVIQFTCDGPDCAVLAYVTNGLPEGWCWVGELEGVKNYCPDCQDGLVPGDKAWEKKRKTYSGSTSP